MLDEVSNKGHTLILVLLLGIAVGGCPVTVDGPVECVSIESGATGGSEEVQ